MVIISGIARYWNEDYMRFDIFLSHKIWLAQNLWDLFCGW